MHNSKNVQTLHVRMKHYDSGPSRNISLSPVSLNVYILFQHEVFFFVCLVFLLKWRKK